MHVCGCPAQLGPLLGFFGLTGSTLSIAADHSRCHCVISVLGYVLVWAGGFVWFLSGV